MSTTVKKIAQSAFFRERIPLAAGSAGLKRQNAAALCVRPDSYPGQNREDFGDSLLMDGKRVFLCRVHKNAGGFLIFDNQDFDVYQYRTAIENAAAFISVKLPERC